MAKHSHDVLLHSCCMRLIWLVVGSFGKIGQPCDLEQNCRSNETSDRKTRIPRYVEESASKTHKEVWFHCHRKYGYIVMCSTRYQTLGSTEPRLWKVHVMPMVSTRLWLSSADQPAPLADGQNHSYLPFPWPPPMNTTGVRCLALHRSHERSPRCLF
jgi:hypothetical protein